MDNNNKKKSLEPTNQKLTKVLTLFNPKRKEIFMCQKKLKYKVRIFKKWI